MRSFRDAGLPTITPLFLVPPAMADHLLLHPLHGTAADADELRHLENTVAGGKLLANGFLDHPTNRWTTELLDPLFSDTVQPATTRARIISRSSSPKTHAIWIMALPNGLVLSMAC